MSATFDKISGHSDAITEGTGAVGSAAVELKESKDASEGRKRAGHSRPWQLFQNQFLGQSFPVQMMWRVPMSTDSHAHYAKPQGIVASRTGDSLFDIVDSSAKDQNFLPFALRVPENISIPEGASIQLFMNMLPKPGAENPDCDIIFKTALVNTRGERIIYVASDALLGRHPIITTGDPNEVVRCVLSPKDPDLEPGSYTVIRQPVYITIIKDGICTPISSFEMPYRFPKDTSPAIMKHFTIQPRDSKIKKDESESTEKWIRENVKSVTPPLPGVKLHSQIAVDMGGFRIETPQAEALANLVQLWHHNQLDDPSATLEPEKYPRILRGLQRSMVLAYEAACRKFGSSYKVGGLALADLEPEIASCKASLAEKSKPKA